MPVVKKSIKLIDNNSGMCAAWHGNFHNIDWIEILQADALLHRADCIVSPANSFGFMDGGFDFRLYKFFGPQIEQKVQQAISQLPMGELLVGQSLVVETGNDYIPHLMCAPTMRVPQQTNTINVYLAAKAIFTEFKQNSNLNSIIIIGLGTGVGNMSYKKCARQMRYAFTHVFYENIKFHAWHEVEQLHNYVAFDNYDYTKYKK